MRKRFCVILFIFAAFSAFGLSLEDFSFYSLDFFDVARLNQSIVSAETKKYKNFFLPKMYLGTDGNISGDIAGGWKSIFASPSVSFSQELPGFASISYGAGCNFVFAEIDNSFSNSLTQSVSVNLPLAFNKSVFKTFNEFGKNYYRQKNYLAALNYFNAVSAGKKDFVSAVGNFLYYRQMIFLNENRLEFLKKLNEDYEKLFALGKITSIELNEQYSKFRDLTNSQQNCKLSLVSYEQKIYELGGVAPEKNVSFADFVVFCEELFADYKETFFAEEAEFVQIETERLKNASLCKSSLSFLTGGFSVSTEYSKNDWPSFDEISWAFNLAVKIPICSDALNFSEMNKYSLSDNLYQIEKARILRRREYSRQSRVASLKLHEDSVSCAKETFELEQERLEAFRQLFIAGRLPETDFLYQKSEVDYSELNFFYSRFNLAVLKAGFY